MPDSKQLAILKALTRQLETIQPVNGYSHDLKGRVFRGQAVFGADETPPFLSIMEAPRPDDQIVTADEDGLVRRENWRLLLQGWTTEDRLNPTDPLYALKADVERCLADVVTFDRYGDPAHPGLYNLGGRIESLRIGPGVVRAATPQAGGTEAFYLPLLVQFSVDLRQPFDVE